MSDETLVTATALEELGILPKGTSYKMVKAGTIPSYVVGVKKRGVRFRVEEVLAALRRPPCKVGETVADKVGEMAE